MIEHIEALMDGLEIPNKEKWFENDPRCLFELGKAIAGQCKELKLLAQEVVDCGCGHVTAGLQDKAKKIVEE